MQRRDRQRSAAEIQLGLFNPKSPCPWNTLSAKTRGEVAVLLARLMLASVDADADDGNEGEEEAVDV